MNSKPTKDHILHLNAEQLFGIARAMLGIHIGREDDENPLPPGPWDPIIRIALRGTTALGPHPEPWSENHSTLFSWSPGRSTNERVPTSYRVAIANLLARHPELFDAIGGGHSFGEDVALNPQPLPPRLSFLTAVAHVVSSRAEMLHELANSTSRDVEARGLANGRSYISRFSDDWCGNGFKLKWPFPGPHPKWFSDQLNGVDLMILAIQFKQSSGESYDPLLRRELAEASEKFLMAGVAKISLPY